MAVLNKANNTTALNLAGAWNENVAPNNTQAGVIGASITGFATGSTSGVVTFANFLLDTAYPAGSNTYSISGTSTFNLTGPYSPNGATQPYSLYVAPGKRLTYEGPIQINTRAAGSEPISEHILFVGAGGSFEVNPSGSGDGRIRIINAAVTAIRKQGTGYVSSGRSATNDTWTSGSLYIDEGEFWLSGFAGTNPIGTNTLYFTPIGAATPTLRFLTGGGPNSTRTINNAVNITTRGTIAVNSGFTAVMTGAITGSGTLTVSDAGVLQWNNNIPCPLNITGTLSFDGSTRTFSGSTLSGAGTFNTAGGTLSGSIDGSGFSGSITGNATISGGISTFNSNFTGVPVVSSGFITFTGTSSGAIGSIGYAFAKVQGAFNTNSGTTSLPGAGANAATLEFYGSGTFASGRTIAAQNSSVINLYTASTLPSAITATVDDSTVTLGVEDASTCTYSGAISTTRSAGNFKIRSKGTLVLSGSASGTQAGRTFALNGDSGYTGTIQVTGAGFSGSSLVTLSQGKLSLNRAGSIGLGGGLTAAANTTVACYSTGAYAAQLTGNLTLNANSTMKFGAA